MAEIYNLVVELLVTYSFQIAGAVVMLIIGLMIGRKVSEAIFNLCQKRKLDITLSKFFASCTRILIVAEESSQVSLVEHYVTVGDGKYLSVPVTEAVVGPNAVVDHYKLQRESLDAYQMSTLAVWQDRDSNFSSHAISWGGAIVRNDVNAVLGGEGAEATLNGLYMVEGTQLVDNHMRVDHAARTRRSLRG